MSFETVNRIPPYAKVIIVMVIAAVLWRVILVIERLSKSTKNDPHATAIKRWCWLHVFWGLGVFASFFYILDYSVADACLIASAIFIYIGTLNPLIFSLLVKARLPVGSLTKALTEKIDATERAINLSAMFAVFLALVSGYAGAFFLANENSQRLKRDTKLDTIIIEHRNTLFSLTNALNAEMRSALDAEIRVDQELNSKNKELVDRIDHLMEDLMTVTEAVQQLKMGEARDMRFDDLKPQQDALATTLKKDDNDVHEHQAKLELINKKLKLWKPVLQ